MAYDEDLANRIRELLAGEKGVVEKKMFGGLAFLIGGNMSVVASGGGEPMVMAGRETRGWVRVTADGVKATRQLQAWVARGVQYAAGLPAK